MLLAPAGPVVAQSSAESRPATSEQSPEQDPAPDSIADALGHPLGGPNGLRQRLYNQGVDLSFGYIGEAFGNASGGIRRATVYDGRFDVNLKLDFDKLTGRDDLGLTFNVSAFQIHGRGLSGCCLGNILPVSGIEALPSTRLFELWFEKSIGDSASLRVGQMAADSEFLISDTASLFVNGTFGWPGITAANLPNGGPAYPLATPGARLEISPIEGLLFRGAVFNGDPAGSGPGDPQRNNLSGTEFRVTDPPLFIGELEYGYNKAENAMGLPGTIKLGAWHHTGRFEHQRFGSDSLSLADPTSSGVARRLRGNQGFYGIIDQMVYRSTRSDPDEEGSINVFARISASPPDRNLISFYADGGITFKGLLDSRPRDSFGIGFGYAQISSSVRGFDQDARQAALFAGIDPVTGVYEGPFLPVRSSEAVIEVTYQAEVARGWTVQPDFQYIIRPGGNVSNPLDPDGAVVKNAAVFGLRTTIRY